MSSSLGISQILLKGFNPRIASRTDRERDGVRGLAAARSCGHHSDSTRDIGRAAFRGIEHKDQRRSGLSNFRRRDDCDQLVATDKIPRCSLLQRQNHKGR